MKHELRDAHQQLEALIDTLNKLDEQQVTRTGRKQLMATRLHLVAAQCAIRALLRDPAIKGCVILAL